MPTDTATTYTLAIPRWRPTLASELKCHPLAAARKKSADARRIGQEALIAGIPPVALTRQEKQRRKFLHWPLRMDGDPVPRRRRVTISINVARGRLMDADAPLKSLLDALVTEGLLVDDSDRWCLWERPVIRRGATLETVVTLEDIP